MKPGMLIACLPDWSLDRIAEGLRIAHTTLRPLIAVEHSDTTTGRPRA